MTVYFILLVGILAVSSASILIKLCDAPSMVIASYRLTISSLVFVAMAGIKRVNPVSAFSQRDLLFAAASGLFLCLHFATWITSLNYTSVANSVVLVSTTPIFVAIGSLLFLKEKISKLQLLGISLTVIGGVVLGSEFSVDAQTSMFGNALALMGAVGGAGYFLLGRELRARIDTLDYVTVVYATTAVLMIVITSFFDVSFVGYTFEIYLLLILIALVPQVIGHTSFNWALKYVSATMVAVITLGEPIGASILAFFILDEKLTAFQMIGGMLILTGVAVAIRGESGRKIQAS
ncbi:DMT family transporter [candidate division KSB1 bacterium]|nr:DMT family transporter [candidate division KSB1 bacterium]NIR73379.1 DMT family transporter [candidate division KSB1 bacterium]NIS25254.1 DMT family transporter [candidate division KSB1 bacterium]NIT72157.1 DMT family transporter [candidate division KSB1 bacterium]NIU25963.1 DMT family transporter [candidate division KSB1 bacterium]